VNNLQLTSMNVTRKTAVFWNVTPCTDVWEKTAALCRADRWWRLWLWRQCKIPSSKSHNFSSHTAIWRCGWKTTWLL